MCDEKIKICSKCKIEKPLSEFGKNKTREDGYAYKCRSCELKREKIYRENNREKLKVNLRRWRKKNPDKVKMARERGKASGREYGKKHREERKARCRRYYAKNKNIISTEKAKRRQEDVIFKLTLLIACSMSLALKDYSRTQTYLQLLGCTLEDFKIHIENQFEEWMTWDNHGFDTWHIDHIKPISHFDLSNPEEQRACFSYKNTQPLSAFANRSKNNRFVG